MTMDAPRFLRKEADFKQFNSKGIVVLIDDPRLDMSTSAYIQFEAATQAANQLKKNHITIFIDSFGEDSSLIQQLIGCMHFYRPKKDFKYIGRAIGVCFSHAFMLLQQCDWRISLNASRFLFNLGRMPLPNSSLTTLFADSTEFVNNYNGLLNNIITTVATRSGQSHEILAKIAHFDTIFSAQSALELNFIDEIVESVPTTSTRIDDRPAF